MKPIIIAILAAPGTGKTFLSEKLSEKLNGILLKEPPINDRILENFKEMKRNLETITYFLNEGIKNIEKAIELKKEKNVVVMDTCWISTILHIQTMLKGFEKNLMLEQSQLLEKYLPKPDILIYLNSSKKYIENNVLSRGRDFDTNNDFLKRIFSIKQEHEDYFNKNKDHIIINKDNLDFENKKDLDLLINEIIKF